MSELRTVEDILVEVGKRAEIVALAVPANGGLSEEGPDTFPQFFRGYVAGRYPHLPLPFVEKIYCPRELYQEAGLSQSIHPMNPYRVDGCASNVLEDFVIKYERRHGKPESDHEWLW